MCSGPSDPTTHAHRGVFVAEPEQILLYITHTHTLAPSYSNTESFSEK